MAQPQLELMKDVADELVEINGTAENKNISKEEIITRYVEVPEENVKAFTGGDVVMDLQLASGVMIQIKEPVHEDPEARYRPVRLIGSLENVEKAEKLIKAVVNLDEAGGSVLLFKDEDDSDGFKDDQEQAANQSRDGLQYAHPPSRAFRKRFCSHKRPRVPLPSRAFRKRFCSHKRPRVTLPSGQTAPVPLPSAPSGSSAVPSPPTLAPPPHSILEPPSYNQSEYAASQAYITPQPPAQQPTGYVAGHAYGMVQPPYNPSSGYGASQAYVVPQPPAYQQLSGYAASQAYIMPQPPTYQQLSGYATSQASVMPHPPAYYGMPEPLPYYQPGGYAVGQAYAMPQPPAYNQSGGYGFPSGDTAN